MEHIAAIFTIIYRFFSNIQFKKYTKCFELVLCVLGIIFCVKVYKSWSEMQHFYQCYSLQKLTKDKSTAKISFEGNFDISKPGSVYKVDTNGISSYIVFSQEESPKHINFEKDVLDDSLKVMIKNEYKEKMSQNLYYHTTSIWKNVIYESTDFFHEPWFVGEGQDGTLVGDNNPLLGISIYTKQVCEVDSIPSDFNYKFSHLSKRNVKGFRCEQYYNLNDIGYFRSSSSSHASPTTLPIKWYAKGDISQFSYSFIPKLYGKDVSIDKFSLDFGSPVSVSVSSPAPDVSNEFRIEYSDSTKLAYIARNGLYAKIELVDNVNLQSYRLYILGAILSILISLALTLLYSIMKSMEIKYSLVFLIIPAIVGFLIRISPLRNFPDAFGGHLVNISISVYWASYALFIILGNFSKYKSNMKRYNMGLLLSACSAFYISNLLAWVYYLIS